MGRVVLIVDPAPEEDGGQQRSLTALQSAIQADQGAIALYTPEMMPALSDGDIVCPLTLDIPAGVDHPGQSIYQACHDVDRLREFVQERWEFGVGRGQFWLPVVWTPKGPLYGEVIGLSEPGTCLSSDPWQWPYQQPWHFGDRWRQPLYHLAYRLLRFLVAPPATYLMQFGVGGEKPYFDRLWPFPGPPAIASIGVQQPDLFHCHWFCVTGKPLRDLEIVPPVDYRVWS